MFGHKWFGLQDFKLYDTGDGGGGGGVVDAPAPVDTTAVIEEAISGIEGAEPVDKPAPEAKAKEEDPEEAEIETIRQKLRAENTKLVGKIDVDRHQAVLTRARNQHEAALKKIQEDHAKALEKYKPYEDPEVQAALQAMELADRDPDQFIKLLMTDERYAGKLTLKQAQEVAKAMGEARPKPNAKQGDLEYYDNDGLIQLLDFERKQAVQEAKDTLMKELAPLLQRHEFEAKWNQGLETNRKKLETARASWPGFKENESEIRQALADDEKLDFDGAYRQVVFGGLTKKAQTSEAEMRKRIMEEMRGKQAAAQSDKPGAGVERVSKDGPRDTEDIINEELRRQGLI